MKSILKPITKSIPKVKTPYVENFTGFKRLYREPKIKNQVEIDEILPQIRFLFNENDTENQNDLIEIPGIKEAVKKWRIKNHNPDLDILMFLHNKENTIKPLMNRMLDKLGYYKLTGVICVKLMSWR